MAVRDPEATTRNINQELTQRRGWILTIAVGFVASVLLGAFLLAVYPAMLSEKVAEGRERSGGAHRHRTA